MRRDLSGQLFGRWTVVRRVGTRAFPSGQRQQVWLCRCLCSAEREVLGHNLTGGRSVSCGCWRAEVAAVHMRRVALRHGDCKPGRPAPEWKAWDSMIQRCHNPRYHHFADYGGRGITVCAAWRAPDGGYEAFRAHVGRRPSAKHSLDRIDNAKGYEPGNVRWATQATQQRNRRSNHLLTINGETHPLIVWSERLGIHKNTLLNRLRRGWTLERAISTPTT